MDSGLPSLRRANITAHAGPFCRPALLAGLLALAAAGCAPLPQYTGLPVVQRPSPNFGERRPAFVILHHTGSHSANRALSTLADPASAVSAHFLIGRDGRIYYLVDEFKRAWHAGESSWGGLRDLNSASIGIELDNNGAEPYAEVQIRALLVLLDDLKKRHRIPTANFLGHGDVSPGRKVDPGTFFPWRRLAGHGFGLWCDPPYPAAPADAPGIAWLSAFGYDVANPAAAVSAFRRHFAPDSVADQAHELTPQELALLYCLLQSRHKP